MLAKILIRLIPNLNHADSKDDDYFEAFSSLHRTHYDKKKWFQFYKFITLAAFQRCAETGDEYVLLWLTKCLSNINTRMSDKDSFYILVDSTICFYNFVLDLRQRYAHTTITFNITLTSISELEKICNIVSISNDEKKILGLVLDVIKAALHIAVGRYTTAYRYIRPFLDEYGEPTLALGKQPDILCGWYFYMAAIIAWRTNELNLAVKYFSLSFCFLYLVAAPNPSMSRYLLDVVCDFSALHEATGKGRADFVDMLKHLEMVHQRSKKKIHSEVYNLFTEMAMTRVYYLLKNSEKAEEFCDFSAVKGMNDLERIEPKDLQKLPGMPADFAFTMLNLFSGTYPWFVKYAPKKGTTVMLRLFKNYFLMLKGVKLASFLVKLLTSIQYDCQNIHNIESIGMCLVTKFSKGKYQKNVEFRLYLMYGLMFMGYAFKRCEFIMRKTETVSNAFFLSEAQWPNELFLLVLFAKTMSGLLLENPPKAPTLSFTALSCPLHRFDVALETNNFKRQIRPTDAIRYFYQYLDSFMNLSIQ